VIARHVTVCRLVRRRFLPIFPVCGKLTDRRNSRTANRFLSRVAQLFSNDAPKDYFQRLFYQARKNFSGSIPASRRIARKVPSAMSRV